MLERASGVKRNRIAESLAEMLRVGSDPIKIRKLLRCGHEDMVLPGIDPSLRCVRVVYRKMPIL